MSKRQKLDNLERTPVSVTGPVEFQIIDIDSGDSSAYGDDRYWLGNTPRTAIRVFGVDALGRSVLVNVHNFYPYIYIPFSGDAYPVATALNKKFRDRVVLSTESVTKTSILGYYKNPVTEYAKITLRSQADVGFVRGALQRGIYVDGTLTKFQTFESSMPLVMRFMIDNKLLSWARVTEYTEKATNEEYAGFIEHDSTCQIEIDCEYNAMFPIESRDDIAPIRIASIDIECCGRPEIFPVPEKDAIIQVSVVIATIDKVELKSIFTLNACEPIDGVRIFSFDLEGDLLRALVAYLTAIDPDIVMGYNIINFDLPYLIRRCEVLGVNPIFGRLRRSSSIIPKRAWGKQEDEEEEEDENKNLFDADFTFKIKQTRNKGLQSDPKAQEAAKGVQKGKFKRDDVDTDMDGRIQMDCMLQIQKEHKNLRSYSLNSVSQHFLGQEKEDVHHSQIAVLQGGTDADRKRLAVYCVKDSVLCIDLNQKLMLLINLIGMSRVTGVHINFLLTRGEGIKAISQIYRNCTPIDVIVPVPEAKKPGEKFEGATVIEPKKGYYTNPIITHDYNSLYPSIMMAYNLCYSTLVLDTTGLDPDDYITTPNGYHFVKPHIKKGILPEILRKLLDERAATRVLMKSEKDPLKYQMLNARQLALKISANSIYGFTGAQVGQLPCIAISSSVTAFGREMIFGAKEYVEKTFCKANGYEFDANVIYGDTDSIMVDYGDIPMAKAMEYGRQAAEGITAMYPNPIKIIFEKGLMPYLLIAKKRYAGLYWTQPDKWDKMHVSGLEIVRRDNCKLVGKIQEEVLHKLMVDNDPKSAQQLVKDTVNALLTNKIDTSMLVISKGLTKPDYKTPQVHSELAARMKKRDRASAPRIGDRVPYVIVKRHKGAKVYECGEDPVYAMQNNIPVDADYYIDNQLKQPLKRIFDAILSEDEVKSLFEGDHTRKRVKITPKAGGIAGFLTKLGSCIECRVSLPEMGLCDECSRYTVTIHDRRSKQVQEMTHAYEQTKEVCYGCQGSRNEIICESKDCDVFYKRFKQRTDMEKASKDLSYLSF